jgi:alanine racemase
MSQRSEHRAWIEVDHEALAGNLEAIRSLAPRQEVIGVVKANAYGHGDVAVARTLSLAGVERLAVATLGEAERLRRAGIRDSILLLFRAGIAELPSALAADVELTLFDARGVAEAERAAADAGRRASVHLKIDTGLARQGADPAAATELALGVQRSRHLRLVGTYTHLAVPGEDDAYTDVQLLRLARTIDSMRSAGIDPGLVHVAASGGVLAGAGSVGDAVRPGLLLYGLLPAWAVDHDLGVRPVLSLRALPLRIFDLPTGEPVGYGLRFRAEHATRIAVLGIGYGDGWPRAHANNGWVLVRGRRAPIVGAISMDAITVDVGDIDGVTYGDEFVIIGEQEAERISADEIADQRRTINYEVTTALRERLPRIHLGGR